MKDINLPIEIKKRLMIEFQKQDKSGVYGYTQRTMAYNSNRIEGSTLTEKQTASIFETGTLYKDNETDYFITKDIEEMTGHFKMFNYIMKNMANPLSIEIIKGMHKNLKEGVFEDIANGYAIGDWKKRANRVSDIQVTQPNMVNKEMNTLMDNFSNRKLSIKDIAQFHAQFENIHPFQEGNGRVGRMIILKQCLDNDLTPIIIRNENRLIYMKHLNDAQHNNNFEPLINFFMDEQKNYLHHTLDLLIDYDILEKIPNIDQYINGVVNKELNITSSKNIADRIKEAKTKVSIQKENSTVHSKNERQR